jgi:Protein of unknown function (DUF2971)
MTYPEVDTEAILNAAFFGYIAEMVARVTPELRLAHYTSAETALRIIRGDGTDQALWLRNATEMNDFSEIEYGQACLEDTLARQDIEDQIKRISEALGIDIGTTVIGRMGEERQRIKRDTFLLCLSEHVSSDNMGVLSMWRAYGGDANVCLLFNTEALTTPQQAYDVDITAVDYNGPAGFLDRFARVLVDVETNLEKLKLVNQDLIAYNWKVVLDDMVLSTKHPAFKEEKEWRIIYRREANLRFPAPPHKIEVVGGIAQVVHYVPMVNVPEKGVTKATLEEILDRVIIGPTANPDLVREAFEDELAKAGISDPEHRVVKCDIPLRR